MPCTHIILVSHSLCQSSLGMKPKNGKISSSSEYVGDRPCHRSLCRVEYESMQVLWTTVLPRPYIRSWRQSSCHPLRARIQPDEHDTAPLNSLVPHRFYLIRECGNVQIANLKVRVLARTLSFSFFSRMPSRNCFFCLVVICPLSLQNSFMFLSVFSYPQNALSVSGKREVRKAHPESWVHISMRYN